MFQTMLQTGSMQMYGRVRADVTHMSDVNVNTATKVVLNGSDMEGR